MTLHGAVPNSSDIHPTEPQGRATPLHFVVGYLAGVGLYLLVRLLGGLNPNPCQGQTLVALIVPLLLGPGGLGLAASQWNRPPRAIFGLGLVVASLFPALFFGARDIAGLRNVGCAGGYVVISRVGGKGFSETTLKAGESLGLLLRVGGFDVKAHPNTFKVVTQATNPSNTFPAPLSVTATQTAGLKLGQEVPMTLAASPGGPTQQYTVNVSVIQEGGRTALGTLTVNVTGK
jgi:hypothetical protein